MTMITAHEGAFLNEHATRIVVQDWTTYLRARLLLLAPADTGDTFERDAAMRERQEAEREMAAIPPELRSLFERAVTQRGEQHRQRLEATRSAGSVLTDPELVEQTAVQELLTEATIPDDTGHILIPAPADHGGIAWLEFRAADLTARPDERAYRATNHGNANREQTKRILAGIAIVVLTGIAIWTMFRPDDPATRSQDGATANGVAITSWPVTHLTVTAATDTTWPVVTTEAGTWPTDGQAAIQANPQLPLQVCAPVESLSDIQTVRIAGDDSTPERVYTISTGDAAPTTPDLRLVACSDPSSSVAAMLHQIIPAMVGAVGSPQPLGTASVTLLAVVVVGPAEQPEVPQGAARVVFTLRGDGVEWSSAAPTLRLGDGTQHRAPDVRSTPNNTTELRFLIPAPAEALPAEVRLTDPTTHRVIRWAVTLTPPADRVTVLRAALKVEGITVSEPNTLSVMVTNQSHQPLMLTAADLTLDTAGTRHPLPSILGIEVPLEADETRTLTVTIPPDLRGAATLRIGAAQFRITI